MKCERNYSSSLNSKLLIPMRVIDFETLWTPLGGGGAKENNTFLVPSVEQVYYGTKMKKEE